MCTPGGLRSVVGMTEIETRPTVPPAIAASRLTKEFGAGDTAVQALRGIDATFSTRGPPRHRRRAHRGVLGVAFGVAAVSTVREDIVLSLPYGQIALIVAGAGVAGMAAAVRPAQIGRAHV